ncbi:dicarboxylate/amino acid:cation symporter [Sandaracinobacteroides saxicola]|uniref:Cation:dicarboxylase symporter family transporter n=1 Tax=Sandaracinobacteroides saxicola TaxID=2759707 RepID=A0A7G5IGA9_9SPHN|nr:cation:dicarboxylase symporter family transporter [Sandaracinobacteroides saxicola]QMW22401.1 cation:dicarboxylase symporter family transporter [Sandaracinobacteroides saxicola]
MTATTAAALRTLAGLLLGLAAGVTVAALIPERGDSLLALADPIGTLWLNALKLTVIPLVLALLISGLASAADTARAGGLAARSLGIFAVMLLLSATLAITAGPALLALSPPPPGLAAAIPPGTTLPSPPPLSQWVNGLIPPNIFKALADGSMLQIVIFGLALGFAALTLSPQRRAALLAPIDALADAMLVIVGWVLWAAPLGVFALAFGLGERAGVAGVGTLVHYVGFVSLMCILSLLLAWLLAWVWGGVPPLRFIRALGPALAVGLGTQSSLATLPLMVKASGELGVPDRVTRLTLPLAVTTFRITSPMANMAVVLYCAAILDIDYSTGALIAAAATALLMSFTVVSLPSQITFFAALIPIGTVLGVPPEIYVPFLAVEILPDLFRTIGNVVADVSAATIAARGERKTD